MPRRRPEPSGRFGATHWNRNGAPKRRFATQADAEVAADMIYADTESRLHSYQCSFCDGWHLGGPRQDD